MKCECGTSMVRIPGESLTMVGYSTHDDNCVKREYICRCGKTRIESLRRQCTRCGWKGKATCPCHPGEKVDRWTDGPHNEEQYHTHTNCGSEITP